MYCTRFRVVNNNFTLCLANLYISINSSFIAGNECFGLWPKHGFLSFF
jgi:hypothetical protein